MRKVFLLVLALVIVCKGLYAAEPRITGGFPINITEAPWQVLIRVNDNPVCGGSIIAPNMILTAAHCLYDEWGNRHPISAISVVAGVTCQSETNSSNTFNVSRIILHDYADAAILVLSSSITFNNYRRPINFLGSNNNALYNVGNTVRASGWGWKNPDRYNPNIPDCLQAVDLTIISNQSVANTMGWNLFAHEMAATGTGNIRQGACHGDSGGPLTIRDTNNVPILIGIVGWGRRYCLGDNHDSPSIFVRVSHIRNWIHSVITPSMSGRDIICANAFSTFTVSNTHGASIAWTTSSGLSISGSSTGNFVQVRKIAGRQTSLNEWVRVTVSHGGNTIFTRQMPVVAWASGTQSDAVSTAVISGDANGLDFSVRNPITGHLLQGGNFQWSTIMVPINFLHQGRPYNRILTHNDRPLCGHFDINVNFFDACGGWSQLSRLFVNMNYYDCLSLWFIAYPNPVRDVLTVRLNDEQAEMQAGGQKASLGNVELRLYNHDGQLVRRQAMGVAARQAAINISGLPAGNYVLNIVADGQVVERQVIVVVN